MSATRSAMTEKYPCRTHLSGSMVMQKPGRIASKGFSLLVGAQQRRIVIKEPHGVGTRTAVDKTSGVPVRTFYRNNDAYWAAEHHNGTLDRDHDRIACEKR